MIPRACLGQADRRLKEITALKSKSGAQEALAELRESTKATEEAAETSRIAFQEKQKVDHLPEGLKWVLG